MTNTASHNNLAGYLPLMAVGIYQNAEGIAFLGGTEECGPFDILVRPDARSWLGKIPLLIGSAVFKASIILASALAGRRPAWWTNGTPSPGQLVFGWRRETPNLQSVKTRTFTHHVRITRQEGVVYLHRMPSGEVLHTCSEKDQALTMSEWGAGKIAARLNEQAPWIGVFEPDVA
jgi:hypothetical protein